MPWACSSRAYKPLQATSYPSRLGRAETGKLQARKGFTLLEVTIVIAILAIILILTLTVSTSSLGRSNLRSARNIIVQTRRRAQTLAQTNVEGSAWGVYISTAIVSTGCSGELPYVILFKGADFNNRAGTEDQCFAISSSITPSNSFFVAMDTDNKGIVFIQLKGEPVFPGSGGFIFPAVLNLTSDGGDTQTITVNDKGVVEH